MSVEAVVEPTVVEQVVEVPAVVAEQTVEVPAVTEQDPITMAKILKQVEFYFGDANLPRDKFLQEKIKEKEGWVDLSVLASFSRMKALSEDISVIAEAVSKSAELLELNEDRTAVRRKTDLPEPRDNLLTSVYIKGFAFTSTLEDIEAFLASVYDKPVLAIRMRRHPDTKEFKGSVFAEVENAEEAERLAAMNLSLPEATEPLVLLVKAKYFEQKNAKRTVRETSSKKQEEARPMEYTKKCLIMIENVPEEISFNQIKEVLAAERQVAFADIANGVATVRFREALSESDELPATVATIKIGEVELTSRFPTEEEEKSYYDAFLASLKAKAAKSHRGGRKGGRPGKRPRTD